MAVGLSKENTLQTYSTGGDDVSEVVTCCIVIYVLKMRQIYNIRFPSGATTVICFVIPSVLLVTSCSI